MMNDYTKRHGIEEIFAKISQLKTGDRLRLNAPLLARHFCHANTDFIPAPDFPDDLAWLGSDEKPISGDVTLIRKPIYKRVPLTLQHGSQIKLHLVPTDKFDPAGSPREHKYMMTLTNRPIPVGKADEYLQSLPQIL